MRVNMSYPAKMVKNVPTKIIISPGREKRIVKTKICIGHSNKTFYTNNFLKKT
jgi:hypothetical protein